MKMECVCVLLKRFAIYDIVFLHFYLYDGHVKQMLRTNVVLLECFDITGLSPFTPI